MVKIPQKKSGDFSLPVLGLGTWAMGGRYARNPFNDDERDIRGIKAAIEAGITHIDTAEIYAGGHAEELVREAIAGLDRTKLFLTSKVSGDNLSYDRVIESAKESLKRLGSRQLDLYLIHWPNVPLPLKDTMRAMGYLLENELTRYIGVSNFSPKELEEAQSHGRYKIVNNQIHYSLAARGHEQAGTLEYCRKHQILVTAYRPLERGSLTSNPLVKKLAEKYGKPGNAIALNWVINKPGVVAIFKTSNPEHLRENLEALAWRLDPEDEKNLDQNFPRGETMGVGVEP